MNAQTPKTMINYTKNLRLEVDGYIYKLSHPRQIFMISDQYERNIQSWFNISGDTFLDIGANIGKYSIKLSNRFKQIHAFEPTPETNEILNHNITTNHIENISVHRLAAWNKNKQLIFYIKNNPGGNSASMNENAVNTLSINAVCIDDLIGLFGKVDLVKIDIEGAEPEALEGMVKVLSRDKPVIIVEVLERNNERVYSFMAEQGYVLIQKQNRNHLFKPN